MITERNSSSKRTNGDLYVHITANVHFNDFNKRIPGYLQNWVIQMAFGALNEYVLR